MKIQVILFFALAFTFVQCGEQKGAAAPNELEIKDGGKEQQFALPEPCRTFSQKFSIDVKENTLNDTAMIGRIKIPPGRPGYIITVDCNGRDSIRAVYKPYKATSGKLVLTWKVMDEKK